MKRIQLTAAAALALVWISCCIGPGHAVPEDTNGGDSTSETQDPVVVVDTTVLMCGIEYPEGYDWRRDTAYGRVTASIVLFRDGGRTLTVPAGGRISPHTDMHYLMDDGHLYSQGMSGGRTYIFRDGEEYVSYEGEEILCGLCIVDGEVYTLGQSRLGEGFSYRRNGKKLTSSAHGHIAGQMNSNPHYRTGALYTDSGHMYFTYWELNEEGRYGWTLVEDGSGSLLHLDAAPSDIFDIRVIDGEVHWLSAAPRTRSCMLNTGATELAVNPSGSEARLCSLGPRGSYGLLVSGQSRSGSGGWNTFRWSHAIGYRPSPGRSYYYAGEEGLGEIHLTQNGSMTVSQPASTHAKIPGSGYYFPTFRDGFMAGGHVFLGLNPSDREGKVGCWNDGILNEVDINGFLSDILVILTPKEKED